MFDTILEQKMHKIRELGKQHARYRKIRLYGFTYSITEKSF